MPLYEYQCDKCGRVFEIVQKFSDDPLSVHADCGGSVQRLLSAPALQFKGSGWYVTDYAKGGKSDSGNSAAKDATPTKSTTESTSTTSSPTAPTKSSS